MALRQMFLLGERSFLCQRSIIYNKFPKSVRHFKRTRNESSNIDKESLQTSFTNIAVTNGPMQYNLLWKPFAFTVVFSTSCFVGAAIWQYENIRAHALKVMRQPIGWFSKHTPYKTGSIRKEINTWWNSLSQAEKLFVPICAINLVVFLAWRVPQLQPVMLKYFCSNPASSVICWPMILSTFSHYSGFHLFANMYVLHSFSKGAVDKMGKEQYLALYLSAGVISSFTSYMYKIFTKQPGFSLGASGSIMAVLGYVCTQYPDTKLGIIFVPFITFPAEAALKFIIGFDLLGLILGWKIFDHAAHLGGVACGIVWCYWGNEYIWKRREYILRHWHSLRGTSQK